MGVWIRSKWLRVGTGGGLRFKGRSIGPVYSTATSIVYCTLSPKEFPHSSPEAPRTTQARETSTSEGGN
jgi:hypothetical protein